MNPAFALNPRMILRAENWQERIADRQSAFRRYIEMGELELAEIVLEGLKTCLEAYEEAKANLFSRDYI